MRYGIPGAFLIPLGSNPDISMSIFKYYCVFDSNCIEASVIVLIKEKSKKTIIFLHTFPRQHRISIPVDSPAFDHDKNSYSWAPGELVSSGAKFSTNITLQ